MTATPDLCYVRGMARIIRLHIEKLPEGVYLGTSEDVQGLVAQADTIPELLALIPDLVQMLDEISAERGWAQPSGIPVSDSFDISLLLAA